MTSVESVEVADWLDSHPPPPLSLVVPWRLQSACLRHIGDAPEHPIHPGYHVKDVKVEGFGAGGEDFYRWAKITVSFGKPDPGATPCH